MRTVAHAGYRRPARCATAQAVAGAGGSGEGGIGDRTEGTREENEDKENSDHYRTQNHPGTIREAGALALLSLGEKGQPRSGGEALLLLGVRVDAVDLDHRRALGQVSSDDDLESVKIC